MTTPEDVAVVYDLDHLSPSGPGRVRVDNVTLALPADLVEDAASAFGDLRYIRAACTGSRIRPSFAAALARAVRPDAAR